MNREIVVLLSLIIVGVLSFTFLHQQGEDILSVNEAIEMSDTLQGEEVKIAGEATKGSIACTQMFCMNSSCCNTCSGSVVLEDGESISLQGESIGCSGNECNVTCTPEVSQEYVVKGTLQVEHGETYLNVDNYRQREDER